MRKYIKNEEEIYNELFYINLEEYKNTFIN